MEKTTQDKITELNQIEQNLHQFLEQRQAFQTQLLEIESALKEIKQTEKSYKIIGNIMVAAEKDDLEKELGSKKEMLSVRIKTIENQEKKIKEKAQKLQKEVMENMEKEKKA